MPVKLLPHLRLLKRSFPGADLSLMKPNHSIESLTGIPPIFYWMFPHKLKYRSLSKNASYSAVSSQLQFPPGSRRFSTGSAASRTGSEVRVLKSLIEDEAELSDWVSELRSDSVNARSYRGDEDSDGLGRGKSADRGSRSGVPSGKRRRESRMDDSRGFDKGRGGRFGGELERQRNGLMPRREDNRFGDYGRSSRGRKNVDSFAQNSRKRGRLGQEVERRNDGFMEKRRERDSDREMSSMRTASRSSPDSFSKNLRAREKFVAQSDGEDSDGFMSRERVNGFQRGLRRGDRISKESLILSDEDEDEDDGQETLKDSFRELISEDDDDDASCDEDSSVLNNDLPPISHTKSSNASDSYLSETRFDQCPISSLSLKAIKDAGFEKMTVVQEATLPVILKGKDVLAKAKTGTGKTVAFLLPSIEVVAKSPPIGRDQKRPPILVLIICPTRELASQAATEANALVKYHPSIGVQVVTGGTRLALEQKRMQANLCQILVATPGRLRDHIENTAGFATRLMGVKVLVLDEADHLLDMGFRKDIEKIIAAAPKQRQTLLFSATVPAEVRQICHIALRRDHEFINTVQEGTEETHSQVRQTYLIAPLDKQFSLIYVLLKDHIADDVDYKVLVFCTTAMVTKLVAGLLGELNLNVREIHSRKPQSYRTRVSDEFRKSKGLILVTSDVSARGVDYPDVTLVMQVGLPADKEQYIHRLGRTGRKGKDGQGILLLSPWEEFFLSTAKDLPILKAETPAADPDTKLKVAKALSHVEMKSKESAYQAWLGYYNSNRTVGGDKYRLVELANEFSRSMGLDNPPALPKIVLGKMGLRNIPGLRSK